MDIGNRIKELLVLKKINQKTLADLLNQPPVYVHNILKKRTLDSGKLEEIAKALDTPIMFFFENDDDSKERPIEVEGQCALCVKKVDFWEQLLESLNKQVTLLEEIAKNTSK